MGLLMSSMSLGSAKMINYAMEPVYEKFIQNSDTEFDEFHAAMLGVCSALNAAMPGKHYNVPGLEEVKEFHSTWNNLPTQKKKREQFIQFVKDNVRVNQADTATLLTGVLAPPGAMAAKKAGESLPQLKMIKNVPDILFVPTATVVALITVRFSKRLFMRS
ncbi:hypothetical protein RchiOBHm_Chr1g0347501 [Rosa chinensis]|uniref:Uncharacterized protein n=1 Tax=Rosa chinensis TaxID=74649 RepID=A0A2P6SFC3_ROSCH|nr:hypothetical protein RchiOBHm_Chr1g0347501 [Rosa chinensis]